MSKIICPTDFSQAANNAVNYAAKLAAGNESEFEILHVQVLSNLHPIASGIVASRNVKSSSDALEKMCARVSEDFEIRCNYSVETTDSSLAEAISSRSGKNNLIVMGTNGADDLFQYIFGSNTFQVITEAKCNLLMVPENVNYSPVKRIVFAWDYHDENKDALRQVDEIFKSDKAEIIFLHVSKEKTTVSDELFRVMREEMLELTGNENRISFDRIFSDDHESFAEKIAEYAAEANADLLALSFIDRGMVKNLFHGQITKELTEISGFPLLVLHV